AARAIARTRDGDTSSLGGASVSTRVTLTSVGACVGSRGTVVRKRPMNVPAAMPVVSMLTDTRDGVTPLIRRNFNQAGGGVFGIPPSIWIAKLTGFAPVARIATFCGDGASPPGAPLKTSLTAESCSDGAFVATVTWNCLEAV